MTVGISRALLADIRRYAAESPHEVCGLLFGTRERIVAVEPAANVHPDPACFFELDPAALFAALRRGRSGGAAVIGHYHSHPGGRAEPSPADAAAADPASGYLWLIVADDEAALFRVVPGGALHGMFDRVAIDPDGDAKTSPGAAYGLRLRRPNATTAAIFEDDPLHDERC